MVTDNILDLIGNTPIVQLRNGNIYAKAEFLNPGGSIKDRIALKMIENAEAEKKLTKKKDTAKAGLSISDKAVVLKLKSRRWTITP